jgi:hypothetical protein
MLSTHRKICAAQNRKHPPLGESLESFDQNATIQPLLFLAQWPTYFNQNLHSTKRWAFVACLVCGLEAEEQLHKTGADLTVVQQVGGYAVIYDVLWLLWDLACHLILLC